MVGALSNTGSTFTVLRHLGQATNALGKSYARLSSGSRINSASDDAAGVAIADRLRVNAKTMAVASRNVSDGLSALAIADGALGQQSNILMRMLELGEQAANGSLSATQRDSLNNEYLTMMREYARIASTAKFNNQGLLSGLRLQGPASMSIQAGISGSSTGSIFYLNPDTGQYSGSINTDTFEHVVDGGMDWGNYVGEGARSLEEILERFPNVTFLSKEGVETDTTTEILIFFGIDTGNLATGSVGFSQYKLNETTGLFEPQDPGFLAALNASDSSRLDTGLVNSLYAAHGIDLAALRFYSASQTGTPASAIEFTALSSATQASSALDVLRAKLDSISLDRSRLGAVESRLGSAFNLLSASRENTLAAEARIRDADVAGEVADLVRNQILQQSAASALSQINQNSQALLSLLN